MEARQCTKCGKMSTSAVKCSNCGFEFPQARTRDDEMEDRLFNEGKKSASETTEEMMDDEMKRPLKVPPPRK
jgi:ribosomal protein L37E